MFKKKKQTQIAIWVLIEIETQRSFSKTENLIFYHKMWYAKILKYVPERKWNLKIITTLKDSFFSHRLDWSTKLYFPQLNDYSRLMLIIKKWTCIFWMIMKSIFTLVATIVQALQGTRRMCGQIRCPDFIYEMQQVTWMNSSKPTKKKNCRIPRPPV